MKLALVGSGNIVVSCLDALSRVAGIQLQAICVREPSLAKAEALARDYGIRKIYTRYAELLQDPDVEVVYLGVPNQLHFAYALAALEANRHVVCEKPLTSNLNQARQLSALARQKQRFLFEAITSIHTPVFARLQQQIARLGPIKLVQANYSQYSSRYADYLQGQVHPVFDPAMSGGALYDINVYNLYLVCALFGAPIDVQYAANLGPNGIDTSGVLRLQYADFLAVCCGAKDSASPGHLTIQGPNGYARIVDAPNVCARLEWQAQGELVVYQESSDPNHMVHEWQAFLRCVEQQDLTQCYAWLDLALLVSSVLEEARRSAGISFADDAWNEA